MNSPLQSAVGVEGNDRRRRIPDRGEYVRKHTYIRSVAQSYAEATLRVLAVVAGTLGSAVGRWRTSLLSVFCVDAGGMLLG
jgi:hypothetical protein